MDLQNNPQPPQYPADLYPNRPVQNVPPPEYQSASQMKHLHSKGMLISLILVSLLLVGTAGFAVWAFMERTEYKNNVDGIVATEVKQAVAANTAELEADFVEREKEPLETYAGPAAFGGVSISYPKTWSAYVNESGSGSVPVEGYFHPGFVPDEGGDALMALKMEVVDRSYADSISRYDSDIRAGRVTASPIEPKKVEGALGTRIDGEIERDVQGSIVLFEIRDKTLVLTTESTQFKGDFDSIILENLVFNP